MAGGDREDQLEAHKPTSLAYTAQWQKRETMLQQGRKQELILEICPLTSVYTPRPTHVCTHTYSQQK